MSRLTTASRSVASATAASAVSSALAACDDDGAPPGERTRHEGEGTAQSDLTDHALGHGHFPIERRRDGESDVSEGMRIAIRRESALRLGDSRGGFL